MPKRRRRRRLPVRETDTPIAAAASQTFEAEYFALLEACDKTSRSLESLKQESAPTQAAALTRALALEAARGTSPDRFVQAMRQIEALEQQHQARVEALSGFLRRFQDLLHTTRKQHRAEVEAVLTTTIARLEEQKKSPGAPLAEIEAQIACWQKELEDLPSSKVRAKPKSARTPQT